MAEPGAASAEPWTIAKVVAWATDDFRRRHIDSPRLDAELLLAKVLGVERIRLFVDHARELTPAELAAYRELIVRRRKSEPLAYILGEREFYGLPFRVDSRVLIPRPDTETLVDVALERTRHSSLHGALLDLCTGSGCVALAFSKKRPTWSVTGVDLSEGAVAVARDNAVRLGAPVVFLVSDLDAVLAADERFDAVTANPPYIPTGDIPGLTEDIRGYEPGLALDGGKDGLDVVRRVVDVGAARLRPGGLLAMEVGHDQASRTAELLQARGFTAVERRRDYGGWERVVSGVRR
ncbi:MAG TPA: peptide chain release factor N(5)-glutamine methyltransferase [Polyangiaceae bacterium]|nr:peptide chain release factor N(5)-glutamine methyltransferase [Polyangiaceae bacterium]